MFAVQAKGKHRSEDTGPQSAPGLPRWQDLDSANAAQKVRYNSAHGKKDVVLLFRSDLFLPPVMPQ